MQRWSPLVLVCLGFACQGCGLPKQATHVLAYRTRQLWNDHKERKRNREWADAAWTRVCADQPKACFSRDHASGFRDGFADFLYRGGTGEAPSLPPKKYRTLEYQTVEGYRAIEEWYSGYRHGAAIARDGGYRRLVTGPPPPGCADPVPEMVAPVVDPAPARIVPQPAAPVETLPEPRVSPSVWEPTTDFLPVNHSATSEPVAIPPQPVSPRPSPAPASQAIIAREPVSIPPQPRPSNDSAAQKPVTIPPQPVAEPVTLQPVTIPRQPSTPPTITEPVTIPSQRGALPTPKEPRRLPDARESFHRPSWSHWGETR